MCFCACPDQKCLSARAIRLVEKCDPKAPENVESTLDVLKLLQDGMEAVLKRVRLKKLRASRGLEQKPRSARADEILKHRRKRRAKIDFACAVPGLQVSLDDSAFCFLLKDYAFVLQATLATTPPARGR
jgi:hypothetical protein